MKISRTLWFVAVAAILAAVATIARWPWGEDVPRPEATAAFLEQHWTTPLPPQGNPPDGFTPAEASLDPKACGQCHAEQFADWSGSKHSRAMGLGISWQFDLLSQKQANKCLRCHAPLAEQKALVALEQDWDSAPATAPPAYVPEDLADHGLVCAACHVRGHVRYGPPARTGADQGPHGGFVESPAFQDSRFCGTCHQFPEDGGRVNGKLREDTVAQWRESPAGREGRTCQSCHMPERRHLWRGIHDPEMTRGAITVDLAIEDGGAKAVVEISNVGAGHHFPTYMVPKVVANLELLGPDGQMRPLASEVIGWQVDVDLDEEAFDTRIPAGERFRFKTPLPAASGPGWRLLLTLDVAPREHYERFFRQVLRREGLSAATRTELRRALDEAVAARYRLLERVHPLPSAGIAN